MSASSERKKDKGKLMKKKKKKKISEQSNSSGSIYHREKFTNQVVDTLNSTTTSQVIDGKSSHTHSLNTEIRKYDDAQGSLTENQQRQHRGILYREHSLKDEAKDINEFSGRDVQKSISDLEKQVQEITKRKITIKRLSTNDSVEIKKSTKQKNFSRDTLASRTNRHSRTNIRNHHDVDCTSERLSMTILHPNAIVELESRMELEHSGQSKPINLGSLNNNNRNIAKGPNKKTLDSNCVSLMSKKKKLQMVQIAAQKRETRMRQNLQRREEIESERIRYIQENTGGARRARLKQATKQKKLKLRLIEGILVCITLGSGIQSAFQTVQKFREYKYKKDKEDAAARLITKQMRLYCFRKQRRRIRNAIHVLGTCFVVKVRLWRRSRRRVASKILVSFLNKLKEENENTGGSLALIVKGKKWRAYRIKIILLQRLWRQKLQIIEAQVELIDIQWNLEQSKRTSLEVDRIHKERGENAKRRNEEIESINRTRRLIKLKNLPKVICESREEIMNELLKGHDLLSRGNITPLEIRHKIIKETLKHIKRLHFIHIGRYNERLQEYREKIAELKRRQAFLDGFSGSGTSSDWIWGARKRKAETCSNHNKSFVYDSDDFLPRELIGGRINIPAKPKLRIILNKLTLSMMIDIGSTYVHQTRQAWAPENMQYKPSSYNEIGLKIAQTHVQEVNNIINATDILE